MEADVYDKTESMEEDLCHNNYNIGTGCDTSKRFPAAETIEVEELISSKREGFNIAHAADIIVCVSREELKRLVVLLLKFLLASAFNTKYYKAKLPSFSKFESICKNLIQDNLCFLDLEPLFVSCQAQHWQKYKL